MLSSLTFILNGASGTTDKLKAKEVIEKICADRGVAGQVLVSKNGAQIIDFARQAASEKKDALVAGGGDGTVNAVASALVGSDIPLGILPLGTLNHLAKDLKIPLNLEDAVANLFDGRIERIDVGEVNGLFFLNNSSLGLYAQIVEQRERQQRLGSWKWVAFVRAARSVLKRHPSMVLRLKIDGQSQLRKSSLVFVGNNQYETAGLYLGTRQALNTGQLSLYVAQTASRADILKVAIAAFFKQIDRTGKLEMMRAREIEVNLSRKQLRVATDGEVRMMSPPLHYSIRPGALGVIVPAAQPEPAAPPPSQGSGEKRVRDGNA